MSQRAYQPEQKAVALAALAANDGNLKRTAREVDVPVTTLRRWSEEAAATGSDPGPVPAGPVKKESIGPLLALAERDLAGSIEALVWRLVEDLETRIASLSPAQAILALCQLIDKLRLLRGEATSINQQLPALGARILAYEQRYSEQPDVAPHRPPESRSA